VAALVEDIQGILPGAAGGGRVACCVAVVAEVVENSGLVVAVAEDVGQGEGLLIVRGGLLVMAEAVATVAGVDLQLTFRTSRVGFLRD
jgi:hypothetical protein